MNQARNSLPLSALLSLSLLVVGATAGAALGAATVQGASGFDGVGAVVIGLMSGGVVGVVSAVLLSRRLDAAMFRRVAIGSSLLAGVLVAWGAVRMRQGMVEASGTRSPGTRAPTAIPR